LHNLIAGPLPNLTLATYPMKPPVVPGYV